MDEKRIGQVFDMAAAMEIEANKRKLAGRYTTDAILQAATMLVISGPAPVEPAPGPVQE